LKKPWKTGLFVKASWSSNKSTSLQLWKISIYSFPKMDQLTHKLIIPLSTSALPLVSKIIWS
jgi:hypothetical protein